MPVQAVAGGEHSHDRRYPRQPSDQQNEHQNTTEAVAESGRQRQPKLLVHGEAKLILDADHHIVKVQLINLEDGQAIREIAEEELADQDYHGILVDIDT